MAVHIDEMTSEVTADAPAPSTAAAPTSNSQDVARMKDWQAQMQRDYWRTAAERFDD
jgi:hypothetical protein